MQEKTGAIFFLIIPKYCLYSYHLLFIWHNHCSYHQALQVMGVDNMVLMSL